MRGSESLLHSLPITLHPATISAMVDTAGTLSTTISRDPGLFLAHLRVIDPPQRGLRVLVLANSPQLLACRSNTIMLSKALSAHTRLSSLNLSHTGLTDATLSQLAPALGAHSSLSALLLDQAQLTGAAVSTLQPLFQKLPALASLSLGTLRLPDRLPIRDAPSHPLAPTLAAAPTLTHLRLSGMHLHSAAHATLPCLRHLELDHVRPFSPDVPTLHTALSAPALTHMHLTIDTLRLSPNARAADPPALAASLTHSLSALAAFTTLQSLFLSVASSDDLSPDTHRALAAALAHLPAAAVAAPRRHLARRRRGGAAGVPLAHGRAHRAVL